MSKSVAVRVPWIDCAKTVAITAVVVDHCNNLLYTNRAIAQASYFSVSLFILLAGITAWRPSSINGQMCGRVARSSYITPIAKLRGLLLNYALAVFLLQIWYTHFFDLKTYLNHLLNFSIQRTYYFLLFFLQLKLISPALVSWCRFCQRQKGKWGWQFATLVFLGWFASVLIRYTYILPVYGGGKYLFGGTYLILYYFGILLASTNIFRRSRNQCAVMLVLSGLAWIIWWRIICGGRPLDSYLVAYWGKGFNPPSAHFMIFAVITLFFTYSFFTLLEESKWGKYAINVLAVIGKHTLYTFMYHLIVRDIILALFPAVQQNIWILRFCLFLPMIVFPVLVVLGVQKLIDISKTPIIEDGC